MSINRGRDNKGVVPVHNEILLNCTKEEWNLQHGWAQIVIESVVSQTKANTIWYHLHVKSKRKGTNEFTYKTETESQIKKHTYGYQEEGGRR